MRRVLVGALVTVIACWFVIVALLIIGAFVT